MPDLSDRASEVRAAIAALRDAVTQVGRERHEFIYLLRALGKRLDRVDAAIEAYRRWPSRHSSARLQRIDETILDIKKNVFRVAMVFQSRFPN